MIRVGDRLEWESDAHVHTKQFAELGCTNTGKIYGIVPVGFTHINDRVEACRREDAAILFVQIDDSTGRIGLRADYSDLVFPDAADDGLDLLADLWGAEMSELVNDLMG